MGTDSVDEMLDDTAVHFVASNSINLDRSELNTASNPGSALTSTLEKKLRSGKIPQSRISQGHNEPETFHSPSSEQSSTSKIALVHPSRLLIPAKTTSDQPLVVYDLDSDEEIEFCRTTKSRLSSNKEACARLLSDDFDIELGSDEDEGDSLELIRPKPVQRRSLCSHFSCSIQ